MSLRDKYKSEEIVILAKNNNYKTFYKSVKGDDKRQRYNTCSISLVALVSDLDRP
jgi:hypothetical protein